MIIKTNRIPTGYDAVSVWPFILMRPQWSDNKGLVEHEMTHYREQRLCLTVPWWILYGVSRAFRQAAEVRAYRRQIEVGGISTDRAADYLLTYRLGITKDEALQALKGV